MSRASDTFVNFSNYELYERTKEAEITTIDRVLQANYSKRFMLPYVISNRGDI